MLLESNLSKLGVLNPNDSDVILCDICGIECKTKYFKEKIKKE